MKKPRINEKIRAKEIRLVGEKGEQLGIMSVPQALEIARKQNLDLIEVAPLAAPPVCRVADYGKYKYEQSKKEREIRRSQKTSELREVRLRPKIDDHDFDAKARSVQKLIKDGDKVKVTMIFRGREVTHSELGLGILKRMADTMQGTAILERQPIMDGKRIYMVLSPPPAHKVKTTEPKKELQNAEVKNA